MILGQFLDPTRIYYRNRYTVCLKIIHCAGLCAWPGVHEGGGDVDEILHAQRDQDPQFQEGDLKEHRIFI